MKKINLTFVLIITINLTVKGQFKFPKELSNDALYNFETKTFEFRELYEILDHQTNTGHFFSEINSTKIYFNSFRRKRTKYTIIKSEKDNGEGFYDNRGLLISCDSIFLYVGFKLEGSSTNEAFSEIEVIRKGDFHEIKCLMVLDSTMRVMYAVYYENGIALYVDKVSYDEDGNFISIKAGVSAKIRELDLKYDMFPALLQLKNHNIPLYAISLRIPHINKNYYPYLWMFQGIYENTLNNRQAYPKLYNSN